MRWGNLGEGGEESVLRRLRSDRDLEHCLLRNSSLLQWLHQNETYTSPKTEYTIRPENKSKHYYVFKFKSSQNIQFNQIFEDFLHIKIEKNFFFSTVFNLFKYLILEYCKSRTGNELLNAFGYYFVFDWHATFLDCLLKRLALFWQSDHTKIDCNWVKKELLLLKILNWKNESGQCPVTLRLNVFNV